MLVAMAARDPAFELIFREYHRMVTAYLYALVGNAEEALDLTQETFVVAYRKIKDCDPRKSLAAWLRSIAWNLASNALRHHRRQRHLLAEAGQRVERSFALFDRVDDDGPWEERLRALDDCVKGLPDPQRRAVTLFYREGESCRQIGARLGVLETTVTQMMWQARRNLRGCIERRSGGPSTPVELQTQT